METTGKLNSCKACKNVTVVHHMLCNIPRCEIIIYQFFNAA